MEDPYIGKGMCAHMINVFTVCMFPSLPLSLSTYHVKRRRRRRRRMRDERGNTKRRTKSQSEMIYNIRGAVPACFLVLGV